MSKKAAASFSHPLKPSELRVAMQIAWKTKKSLMIWGAPGIGKSMLAQRFADEHFPIYSKGISIVEQMRIEADNPDMLTTHADADMFESRLLKQETNLVDFRLSQVDPTDMRGIPVPITYYVDKDGVFVPDHLVTADMEVTKKAETVWAPAAVLNLPKDWKGIIFMDEVNGAMPIVQAACYQLFLDRKLGELELPDEAMVLAAGNRENDGGVTFNLATPLKDRMIHVELVADLAEWTEYAMDAQVHPMIVAFLQSSSSDFNTLSPKNPNICGGSSPRSWVGMSDVVYEFEQMFGFEAEPAQERILTAMMDGMVGDDIAGRVKTFRRMVHKLPAVADILKGKVTNANDIKDMDISKHYAICFNLVYAFINVTEDFQTKQIDAETYHSYSNNFLKFLDTSYEKRNTELSMMAVKKIFSKRIFFNPSKVPFYVEFGRKYNELITAARVA